MVFLGEYCVRGVQRTTWTSSRRITSQMQEASQHTSQTPTSFHSAGSGAQEEGQGEGGQQGAAPSHGTRLPRALRSQVLWWR